jgi:hypothetical protein
MSIAREPDLFALLQHGSEHDQDVLREVVLPGLALLASSMPLWPVPMAQWLSIADRVAAFARGWHGRAWICGWSLLALYGLCPRAPYARLDRMGAGWLAARHRTIAVDKFAFDLRSFTGAPLRIYRPMLEAEAVLPWEVGHTGHYLQVGSSTNRDLINKSGQRDSGS